MCMPQVHAPAGLPAGEVVQLVQNLTDALLGLGRKKLTSGQLAEAWWLKC